MALPSLADWKKVLKEHPEAGDAAPLTKALEALAKAEKGPPAELHTTLEELIARAETVKRKNAKAKKVVEFVDDLIKTAQKEAKAAAAAADKAEEESEEDGEDLLGDVEAYAKYARRMLRKARLAPLAFAVGVARKPTDTRLLLHKSKQGQVLAATLKRETGLKALTWGVAGAHAEQPNVLVLALDGRRVPGLAKKAKAFFLAFKPMPFDRVQLLVDGAEVEDLPDEEDDAASVTQSTSDDAVATASSSQAEPAAVFVQRLKALKPALDAALAAKDEDAGQLKLWSSEMGVFARNKDFAAAQALLERIAARLHAATPPSAASDSTRPAGHVAFTQTRLAWDKTRKKVQADLRKLEQAILERTRLHSQAAAIAAGTRNLYRILEVLDERLIDTLDEALNATSAQARNALVQQARELVDAYLDYVKTEELLQDIDDNGFVKVEIAATLTPMLNAMAKQLKVAVSA